MTNRERVLDESGVDESSTVLEIGAGNGFITEAIARRAKKVYANELQPGMVRKLKKRMEKFGDRVD
ncbi:MAG: methyltransferase domain-containing protein, partial [Nitrospiraceae bacterium]|nr:methyltransferase domain-containing protein [Nitrospiraceae bacterium]